jgi:hypothetical protein
MICLVINNVTNQLVNTIVAELTDTPPEGCRLIESVQGMYWNGSQLVPIPKGMYWDGSQLSQIPVEEITDGN